MTKKFIIDPRTYKRDIVLNLLRNNPMMANDIVMVTRYSKSDVSNILTGLKKKKLIEKHGNKLSNGYFWKAVENAGKYSEMVECNVQVYYEKSSKKKEIPIGARLISSDDYHTYGHKLKTNAWAGYGSFGII